MTKRQVYNKEFKLEAIRLLESGDKTGAEVALQLGIRRNLLYKWQEQLRKDGDVAFTRGIGRPKKTDESEVVRLRKELERVKMERDILKKAAAYFAKDLT